MKDEVEEKEEDEESGATVKKYGRVLRRVVLVVGVGKPSRPERLPGKAQEFGDVCRRSRS